jgi:hypothetical protein
MTPTTNGFSSVDWIAQRCAEICIFTPWPCRKCVKQVEREFAALREPYVPSPEFGTDMI